MHEIAKVALENEMDLILAHKRAMKLGELAGLSLASQTIFATAVSEVARNAIDFGVDAWLTLGITSGSEADRSMVACINDRRPTVSDKETEGLNNARRLVDEFYFQESPKGFEISLLVRFPASYRVSEARIEAWKRQFIAQTAVSPYEELRGKNRLLQELAERLRASEKQYQLLTNSLPLMIFSVTNDGQVLYANDWMVQFTGCPIDELNSTEWRTVIHPDDLEAGWKNWRQATADGKPFQSEVRVRQAATGAYVWHLVSTSPLRNEQNEIQYWSGFMADIQAQKTVDQTLRANEELQETKMQLEQYQNELKMNIGELNRSNQELAEFAYVASHDLQEPLRKIQSFGTLLLENFAPELSPTAQDMIHRMHTAAERMHGLIKDLLSYSRLNTYRQPFRPVDLNVLVKEVLGDLEITVREKGAKILTEPLPVVKGNALQLRQMFQNLLSNALKFTTADRAPVISVQTAEMAAGDVPVFLRHPEPHYLAIRVADNGIGFDEKYHDRIFQLFQRLHGKDQYSGTGIGLTICKKVAEMHGGTIGAQAQPGQGATFTIYLPNSSIVESVLRTKPGA
ncbi:ATP-binding protein [Larkinella soli]|uniref:ATP-binding protein n=1 Tax=Larkinella soli TaxID=1770527 RepID=UPI000FFB365C|nr:ATP-binding protein [Larkinella soli]